MIFLINFTDRDYAGIEYYLKRMGSDSPIQMTYVASDDKISNKRADLYLKGGVFAISNKCIVLDLLTKKLSPSIITGFIINSAQKMSDKSQESFLTKLLRKENPEAFIKCITDKPNSVGRGGMFNIESLMKNLQVNNLLLYPRIRK